MQSLFKAISLTGIEFLFLQALGFPRKKFYHEENILENQIIHFSLPFCHARFLKSTNFTLSSLVLALFLSSNVAYATGEVTIGNNASASPYGVAIGDDANASGSGSGGVAIGGSASVKKNLGIAVGELTEAKGESSVVIGAFGIADGKQSVALGANSRAKNDDEVNIGIWSNDGLKLYGTRTLSGLSAGTKDDEAVNKKQLDTAIASISGGVSASDAQNMADTAQTTANEHTDTEISNVLNSGSSTAGGGFSIGKNSDATGQGSTATGQNAQAKGDYSTAAGKNAQAKGNGSAATGAYAKATGQGSTATGQAAQARGDYSTVTGQNALATGANSVALGSDSVADQDNQVSIGQKITDATTGAVRYITRTLSNLTDGTDAHDAVNKGQLDDVDTKAQGYATTAQTAANKHTDDEIGKLDTKAQGYATTAQSAAEKYTDNATLQANQKVLQKANTYTDNTAKDVLKSANDNTERRAAVAEDNAIKRSGHYTDERSVQTLNSANTYTNHRAIQAENNAVARSNNYTDNRFGELRKSMKHTEKRLNAGIAGVTALSSIPYSSGNNFSYGIGVGNYQNGNAVAAGVQFRASPSTNVRLNISWDSAGNNATGIGIAGGW
ncbi:hypothetical protein S564_004593 [Salmonella enterica subsp. enterica]|nr:hypothetical protein [Salmonella enterica subsp. enterica]